MRLAANHARTLCYSVTADAIVSRYQLAFARPLWEIIPRNAISSYGRAQLRSFQTTKFTSDDIAVTSGIDTTSPDHLVKLAKLPTYCPGCGAPSQIVSSEDAGYYTLSRQGLQKYLRETPSIDAESDTAQHEKAESSVICDRCHNLLHHSEGVPIFHPSIQSIHDIIEESPHKHNHIYHILDAADLPMSLIPSLQADLRLPRLRSQNRRSKHTNFTRGRSAEVSFIITRADLLAPKKEQVDSLMPYIREVLRDALGQTRKNVRLGNLRCVSAKRGWWTSHVKEDIWNRGGAGWMVGKVNVGKSSLFEVVFPKGRGKQVTKPTLNLDQAEAIRDIEALDSHSNPSHDPDPQILDDDPDLSLLPPARPEVAFPAMPISSALPGTTASPIRVPFGSGRGELIDLPGISRSTLESYVLPISRDQLVMRSRISAEQHVIKPGQSLLLGGGLIRITPSTPDQIVLAYPFVPLETHVTSTAKAEEMQAGVPKPGVPSVLTPDAHKALASAGPFEMKWDVTRARAGPLTSKSDAKLKPSQLAFSVWGADVVIEGVGWVELVAQTRKGRFAKKDEGGKKEYDANNPFPETAAGKQHEETAQSVYPVVEVFSPEGKHVALRRPMNAWLLGGKRVKSKTPARARPRRSMTSLKQSVKGREMAGAGGGGG